ncbi:MULTISPECIES: hypothetical protein [unclassified Microbacterium]|nr:MULTISPECIES: hypothetical protein [unclassified Microbacterium]
MDEDRENLLMRKKIIDGYIAALENPRSSFASARAARGTPTS